MPIVINEFEVVDPSPGTPNATGADTTPPAQQPRLDEEDLRRMLAELAEQALRIWSH